MSEPVISTSAHDQFGLYLVQWNVPMPAAVVAFRVIRESWDDNYGIRSTNGG